MTTGWIIVICVTVVLIAGLIVLYFLGKKAEKKQAAQQEQMNASAQTVSMLVIDKKKMRMKDAGLPQVVIDQAPKLARLTKLPIVKAKVGPQVLSLVCDAKIFDTIPTKKEIKAQVSGIYIVSFKGLRGSAPAEAPKKSKWKKFMDKVQEKAGAKPLK